MRHAQATLTAGLTLLGIALAVTLTRSPVSVARTNIPAGGAEELIAETNHGASYCQSQEEIPRGVSAIRVWLHAAMGPRLRVTASVGGRQVLSAQRGSGWSGASVTIPVRAPSRTIANARICVSFQMQDETLVVQGNIAPPAVGLQDGDQRLPARMWIEYLRTGTQSWASLIPSVVRHMGFGHAEPGRWSAFVALALLVAAAVLASSAAFKELR